MDKQREEFETWWRSNQLKTFPKDYEPSRLANWGADYKRHAWLAWQAAQPAPDHLPEAGNMVQQPARAQPSQAGELSDKNEPPFAWWCESSDCITRSSHVLNNWITKGIKAIPLYK